MVLERLLFQVSGSVRCMLSRKAWKVAQGRISAVSSYTHTTRWTLEMDLLIARHAMFREGEPGRSLELDDLR